MEPRVARVRLCDLCTKWDRNPAYAAGRSRKRIEQVDMFADECSSQWAVLHPVVFRTGCLANLMRIRLVSQFL